MRILQSNGVTVIVLSRASKLFQSTDAKANVAMSARTAYIYSCHYEQFRSTTFGANFLLRETAAIKMSNELRDAIRDENLEASVTAI